MYATRFSVSLIKGAANQEHSGTLPVQSNSIEAAVRHLIVNHLLSFKRVVTRSLDYLEVNS